MSIDDWIDVYSYPEDSGCDGPCFELGTELATLEGTGPLCWIGERNGSCRLGIRLGDVDEELDFFNCHEVSHATNKRETR